MWESFLAFSEKSGMQWDQWIIAYLILLVPVIISMGMKLELHGELVKVSLRAVVQLLFIALLLLPIFAGHWSLKLLIILVMILMGARVSWERGREIPGAFVTSLLAMSMSTVSIIGVFLLSGGLENQANVAIPIFGMLVGNASRSIALLFSRTLSDFSSQQEMVEALMLDGMDFRSAMRIPMQMSMKTALVPRIDSLKTLGIVHIPGAMAGMMVAGASPLEAAGYQILIFFGIIASSAIATIITNYRSYRLLFLSTYPHLHWNQ